MKVYTVYKCPLCGKLSRLPNESDIPYDELPKVLGSIVRNQQFFGNPALYQAPMYIVCKCADGNAGLAHFAGFVKVREDSQDTTVGKVKKFPFK